MSLPQAKLLEPLGLLVVRPSSAAGPGDCARTVFSGATELLGFCLGPFRPLSGGLGSSGEVSVPRHHLRPLLASTSSPSPQPTLSYKNEAPWERKKEYLWGLAFLGFIPIKTETGLQSQQNALACQTAAIRLRRIYGLCDSQGGARVLAGR